MVVPIEINIEKVPDPEKIEVLHVFDIKAEKYIGSLMYSMQFKIRKLKGEIEFSRSGLSAILKKLYVMSETNQHVHEVYIFDAYGLYKDKCLPLAIGDWYLDGEEVALIVIPRYIMARIRSLIEGLVKARVISEGEFNIEISKCRILAPGDWY